MLPRRAFLKSSGLALVAHGLLPSSLLRAALAETRPTARRRTLVVLFQRGACDGLNMLVPHADRHYARLRPSIGIPAPRAGARDTALDLDGFFGLHPALEPLLPLWREGRLAAVHAVGSPDATRSHFDAQDYMESGTPGRKSTTDGWMNRALQAQADAAATPFRAVALQPTLPRALSGRAPAVALRNTRDFALRRSAEAAALGRLYAATDGGADAVQGAGHEALEALEFLRRAAPERHATAPEARYPRGAFGESLAQIAQLVKADVGLQLAFTEIGGWDHHAAEGGVQGQLATRLRELGRGLYAFDVDLGTRRDDVLVVTLTEFGRTARENGNRGTDHGHASASFVIGSALRGGRVHGRWPGLEPSALFEGRDLAVTTDFRDLLGELLDGHLGLTSLASVFPGHVARFPGVLRA